MKPGTASFFRTWAGVMICTIAYIVFLAMKGKEARTIFWLMPTEAVVAGVKLESERQ